MKMEHPITIRLINKIDTKATAKVYADAFNKADIGESWSNENAEKLMDYFFEKQPDLFFIAEQNNEILGGAVGLIVPWDQGNIITDTEFFVDPKVQNKGIAKMLLKKLIEESIDKYQITTFGGIVDTTKDFPMNWYNKIGVNKTGLVYSCGEPEKILNKLQ